MDGHDTRGAYAPSRILVGVRLTLLLGCAALLLVFHGDISARLANAESVDEMTRTAVDPHQTAVRTVARESALEKWSARERAITMGLPESLHYFTEEPVTCEDLAGRRWGRGGPSRSVLHSRVLVESATAREMIAALWIAPAEHGWRHRALSSEIVLAAFVREDEHRPWRVALEVPLMALPWTMRKLKSENRGTHIAPSAALRSQLRGRRLVRAVSVPLINDRTLACGALRARLDRSSPTEQLCVAVADARPERAFVLGSTRPGS